MPVSFTFNKAMEQAFKGLAWETDTIRAMLMQSAYNPDRDADFVSNVSANEASGGSYARLTLASKTVAIDDAGDKAVRDAADLTQANSNAFASPTSGQDIIGAVLYKRVGADDSTPADDPLLDFVGFGGGPISAVNTTTEVFTIAGVDLTATFPTGARLRVHGSTGNDGTYTVASSAFTGGNTEITVNEDVTNATADGTIYKLLQADGNNIEVTFHADGIAEIAKAA